MPQRPWTPADIANLIAGVGCALLCGAVIGLAVAYYLWHLWLEANGLTPPQWP